MPEVSVIVPIYNTRNYLNECLGSIAVQTFKDLEIILVNDASTDDSGELAEAFCSSNAHFSLFHLPVNLGLGGARNYGISKAKGRYVMFLDSDDCYPIDAVECLYSTISAKNADMALGNMCIRQGHRLIPQGYIQDELLHMTTAPFDNIKLCPINYMFTGSAVNRIYRRTLFENGLNFAARIYWEDMLFSLEAWHCAQTIVYTTDFVYIRTIRDMDNNEASITQCYKEKHFTDRSILLEKMFAFCLEHRHEDSRLIQYTAHLINRFTATTQNMIDSNIVDVEETDKLQVWYNDFVSRKDEILQELQLIHQ